MYQFSVPMPYSKEDIDKILDINNQVEKSRITTLYFSLPVNSTEHTGFEQGRFCWDFVTDFEYWKPLIEYSLNKDFDFIYLLNSPKIYNPEFDNVDEHLEKLDKLLNNLRKLGCNKVRVCNPQLMGHLNENYPDIELYLSTSTELQSIKQYANLLYMFKNIKEIVPSWDLNKNFKFLKNIKKRFPNIKIELMVNEGCLPACPIRTSHNIFITGNKKDIAKNINFTSIFYLNNCSNNIYNNIFWYLCNSNIIYPWEIEEYSKIGINNFKFVGRNSIEFINGEYINYYKYYLKGVDNIQKIKDLPIRFFNHYIQNDRNINIKIKEIKDLLPNIIHFKKYGHFCASRCGTECNYCNKCAIKIEKVLKKKNEKEELKHRPLCINSRSLAGAK